MSINELLFQKIHKMIRTILREYLSMPNLPLQLGTNTQNETTTTETVDREPLEGKALWLDFNNQSIESLFSTVLSQPFNLPLYPTIFPAQLRVGNERSFDSVLLSHNCKIVNAALRAATKYMNLPAVTWLVGSYAEQVVGRKRTFPDWAGISEFNPSQNILLGDSKFAHRPFDIGPEDQPMEDSDEADNDDELGGDIASDEGISGDLSMDLSSPRNSWTKVSDACLEQVNLYARDFASRYCYLVSPIELLVARRTMDEPMSPSRSLAATREPREPRMEPRLSTPTRQLFSEPLSSSPLFSSSPYTDFGQPDTNMRPLQLWSISWEASGTDSLTFNLAMWALHILAALDRKVQTEYFPIAEDPLYLNWNGHVDEGRSGVVE